MTTAYSTSTIATTPAFSELSAQRGALSTPRPGEDESTHMFDEAAVSVVSGTSVKLKPTVPVTPAGAGSARTDFTV